MIRSCTMLVVFVMLVLLLMGCGGAVPLTPVTLGPSAEEIQNTITTTSGDTWMKTVGGYTDDTPSDIQPDGEGGYIIAGGTNMFYEPERQGDVYIIHVDKNGKVLREKTIEKGGYELAKAVSLMNDGSLLISGVIATEANGMDCFLMELDQGWNEVWSKILGGPLDEYCTARPLKDGGYIVKGNIVDPENIVADAGAAGYPGYAGLSNIYLSRLDGNGDEIWTRIIGGADNVMTFSSIVTQANETVILGNIYHDSNLDGELYLFKIDENGNEIWSHTWEEGNLCGYSLTQTSDGGYMLAGSYLPDRPADPAGSSSDIKADYLLIKVDAVGNEVWQSNVGDPGIHEVGTQVIETSSGEYMIAGYTMDSLYGMSNDLSLARIDADGKLVWAQTIITNNHSMFKGILPHPDGGYLVVGFSREGTNLDILLIKTDEQGQYPQ